MGTGVAQRNRVRASLPRRLVLQLRRHLSELCVALCSPLRESFQVPPSFLQQWSPSGAIAPQAGRLSVKRTLRTRLQRAQHLHLKETFQLGQRLRRRDQPSVVFGIVPLIRHGPILLQDLQRLDGLALATSPNWTIRIFNSFYIRALHYQPPGSEVWMMTLPVSMLT